MLTIPIKLPDEVPAPPHGLGQILAIGDFDGIHLGHQEVIHRAVELARRKQMASAVMTFHPHPRTVLGRSGYERLLSPLLDKLERFAELGIDYTYVVTFDRSFSELQPEQFVDRLLVPLRTVSVMVGFDFRFGHRAAADADKLCELGRGRFAVEVVRPCHRNGIKVSSTSIREYLLAGEVQRASELLGRPYRLQGRVVTGDRRGRTIGFPTANLELLEPYVCPKRGVYAVQVEADGSQYDGVMNIGLKPTFTDDGPLALEVHLFDYSGDLYGQTVAVSFIAHLRDERKFASIDELVQQISADAAQARTLLLQTR